MAVIGQVIGCKVRLRCVQNCFGWGVAKWRIAYGPPTEQILLCLSVCGQLVTETDSSCQVIGAATSAQSLNAGVVNSLFKFHQAVSKVRSFERFLLLTVDWPRGSVVRTSVSGSQTLPDLRLTYGWQVTTV